MKPGDPFFLYMLGQENDAALRSAAQDIVNHPGFRQSREMDSGTTAAILRRHGIAYPPGQTDQRKLIEYIKELL